MSRNSYLLVRGVPSDSREENLVRVLISEQHGSALLVVGTCPLVAG
jgi:hypothetical protein